MDLLGSLNYFSELMLKPKTRSSTAWYSQAPHIRGDVCGYVHEGQASATAFWFGLHLMDPLRLGAVVTRTFASRVPSTGDQHWLQLEPTVSLRVIVCGQHSQQQACKHGA